MSDFKLASDGLDLDLSTFGIQLVDGVDAIAQQLLIRLRFFKGEYFLNLNEGVPYFEDILVKNPSTNILRSVFRETILETPGVLDITAFALSLDSRKLLVEFSVKVTGSPDALDFSEEFLIGGVI